MCDGGGGGMEGNVRALTPKNTRGCASLLTYCMDHAKYESILISEGVLRIKAANI